MLEVWGTWPRNVFYPLPTIPPMRITSNLMAEWMCGQSELYFLACCARSYHLREAITMRSSKISRKDNTKYIQTLRKQFLANV